MFSFISRIYDNKAFLYSILLTLCAAIVFSAVYLLHNDDHSPNTIIAMILVILVLVLTIIIVSARAVLLAIFKNYRSSQLRSTIVMMFVSIAAIPTIIVSCFSVFFFNFGIQAWFDDKVSVALQQSMNIAQAYISEHRTQMKNVTLAVARDLDEMHYELIHDAKLFTAALNTQIDVRSLSEAIVFQRSTNTILAQSSMSFSLAFARIPMELLDQADEGSVVELQNDPYKIRMIIKLTNFADCYMIVGKLIDKDIIRYIDQTQGANDKYSILKKSISNLEIKFSIVFMLISIILVLTTVVVGVIFANYIVKPIKRLLKATEIIQEGNLSLQVKTGNSEDELTLLTNAFNNMIRKLDKQQKDLAIAQRAIAWSDVARRVAHEIKNPLTPIMLSAEILLRKFGKEVEDKDNFAKHINTILRHTTDITKIVSNFSNFAKMPNAIFEEENIVKVVGDLVESRKMINESITYEFSYQMPSFTLVCDKTQMHQIIVNLCKNAEEALEGLPHKKIISVAIISHDEILEIIIRDNGKGFPSELIDKIAEPYVTTRTKGTGLGLSIVKKIVEEHCGSMEISNYPQGGALIKLIFDTKLLRQKLRNHKKQ